MITALILAGTMYASYTIPVAERECAVMKYGFSESTTFAPNVPVHLPPFDASIGTLTGVRITFNITPTWEYRAENVNVQPTSNLSWYRAFNLNVVYRPSFVGPVEFDPRNTVGDLGMTFGVTASRPPLTAFDGSNDFAGSSGFSTSGAGSGAYTVVQTTQCNSSLELWWYSQPGVKTFYISPRMIASSTSGFPAHWASESKINVNLSGAVMVQYTYQ